ncbi:MAG: indolepyruvate oxidoreductase subunit beta [Desulfobacterales bacterium]|jgi:indolepyruvate ferredoxin oxidoreductase beta subunit|nr:indolepyruvate oxidoreductase subunit beta [Desulfobacterales bacterium]
MENGIPLVADPYNLIITGVGGQGNVLASRIIADMLTRLGFTVTIGETFGASQRGGSVMSHLRVSARSCYSPQIPKGRAHMVVALEPTEAIRVLKDYGNPGVKVIANTRPIQSIGVICGEQSYPTEEEIRAWLCELSESVWFIDTTQAAIALGNPIFGNIMAVGALSATGALPLQKDQFEAVLREKMSSEKVAVNLTAFDMGREMLSRTQHPLH